MKDTIRFGVVGLGWPGHRHTEAILGIEGCELYACSDTDEKRRNDFASLFKPRKTYASYQELYSDPQVDAVIICLPNFLHFPATLEALMAGKHVVCEKPPTMNAGEMRALKETADSKGLLYFFGRQSRFDSRMRAARQMVCEGRLGQIYLGKGIYVRSRGIPVGVGGWFIDKSKAGGGAMIDLGVHALDAVWYMMGSPKPVSVSANVYQNFPHYISKEIKYDVEDAGYAFIRFENDAVVQLEVCWAGNLSDEIPPSGWSGTEMVNTFLYGHKAGLRLYPFTLFEDNNGKLETKAMSVGGGNPFHAQLKNFVGAVRGDEEPINDSQDAIYLMEMLDAIYASSTTKREIVIS